MFIILHPEDLSVDFRGDKGSPTLDDFKQSKSVFNPAEVVLYRYDDQTLVLKGNLT